MLGCDVLLVTTYTESARDLTLVAAELRRRGHECLFCLLLRNPRLAEIVSAAGFRYRFLGTASVAGAQERERPATPTISGERFEPALNLRGVIARTLGVATLVSETKKQRRFLRQATDALVQARPRVVVLDRDSVPPGLQIAHAAKRLGCPSVAVQSSILSAPRFIAERNLHLELAGAPRPPLSVKIATRIVAALWPRFVVKVGRRNVINVFGPLPVLAGALTGVLPLSNWLQFGGPATMYSIAGDSARKVLIEYGIDPARLCVCGQPRMDMALRAGQDNPSYLFRTPGTPLAGRIRVLVATAPWERYGICSREEKHVMVAEAVGAVLAAAPGIEVQVKCHPLEVCSEYDAVLGGFDRCTIVSDEDIISLIAGSDIFLTQVSTSAYFAIAAGRPVVTFNFDEKPIFDLLFDAGIGNHVRTPAALQYLLESWVRDPSSASIRAAELVAVRHYSRFDGGATAAVVDLVERVAVPRLAVTAARSTSGREAAPARTG